MAGLSYDGGGAVVAVGGEDDDTPVILALQSPAGDGAYLLAVDQGEAPVAVYSTKETTFSMDSDHPEDAITYPQGWQNLTEGKINCSSVSKVTFLAEGWNGVIVGQ